MKGVNQDDVSKFDAYFLRVPFVLIRSVGIQAAAFIVLCEYFSSKMSDNNGWFYFPQTGCGSSSGGMFSAGSFHQALGIGKGAQLNLRNQLKDLGVLSDRFGDSVTAFIHEHRKGIPPNIFYRVDRAGYYKFLEDESVRLNISRPSSRLDSKPEVLNQEN